MTNLTGISVPSLKIFFTFIIKTHELNFVKMFKKYFLGNTK